MDSATLPLCYSRYTVPTPGRRQIVAVTLALRDRRLRHVQLLGHSHREKENSDEKSLKSNASLAVVIKPKTPKASKGKINYWQIF